MSCPAGTACDLLLADRARLPGRQVGAQCAGFVGEPGGVQVRAGGRRARRRQWRPRLPAVASALSGLVPVVPGGQVSGQGVVHDRSGPSAGAERGFRGGGPQRGLSSAVGVLGGVRLGVELGMACAEGGECGGEFIQVVRDGDGGKRGGLLGRRSHGLLSLGLLLSAARSAAARSCSVCCSAPSVACFASPCAVTALVTSASRAGRSVLVLARSSHCWRSVRSSCRGRNALTLFRGQGVCGLCCVVNLGRFGERAGGGGEVGVESGNAGRDLDGGQRLLLRSQFVETVASVGDGLRGLLEVG